MPTTIKPVRPATPPSFMSLPPEIRLQIYTHLLLLPAYTDSPLSQPQIHPSILLANRQINREGTPLLYTKNMFLAHPSLLTSFPRLRTWYTPVREASAISRIRRFRVVVRLDCDMRYTRDMASRMLSGMDEVVVEVVQAVFLGAGPENLRVLEGVRGVRSVVVRGSTTGFEGYVGWLRERMEMGCEGSGEFGEGDVEDDDVDDNTEWLR
ncbi:hypothetical protein QQS21_004075 [Conoideocrella luteorostrata]|uniref:Uncharacterized protein n=1 Tax=Conoideocrella luteorostrata TaxID=1105319 RepID=A0AAJ0FUY9_9HYPO|nr:hypothetical protein QQS21_004075 [Conoideocrella luteorostrata]